MKRKNNEWFLVFLAFTFLLGFTFSGCNQSDEKVELTFTSWRIDDKAEMDKINALYTQLHPGVTIRFDSYDPTVYENTTTGNLANGNGADILFLISYDKGRKLYDAGYLSDLSKVIPNLASFQSVPLKAWSNEGNITYGVPSVGVTHGIYYQKSVFTKYNIQEPATWDEFIAACEKILAGGETVIAQGASDSWTLNRVMFCGLGPNFYDGEASRQSLMAKTLKLTDSRFVDAFSAMLSLKKYFPKGFETLGYEAARQLFASGKAAMFIGGSWEISVFEGLGATSSTIGWFPPPVKKAGDKLQYCFHVDAGIGVNKKSKYPEEALEYLKWVSGTQYAQAIMAELPGFFSYTPGAQTPANALAQEMFNAASTSTLTVRLMSEKLNSGTPGGEELLSDALQKMMLGTYTPQAAAAYVQGKLDTWY